MAITALPTTTLTNALDATTLTFLVGSTANIVVTNTLIIGGEKLLVLSIPVAGQVTVMRGVDGSHASPHSAGALVTVGSGATLNPGGTLELVGNAGVFPNYRLPVGRKVTDPNTGFVYMMVDAQSALVINEWCVIDGNGFASQLAAASVGRVGIVVDAAGASDTLCWVLIAGTHATARTSSDFVSSQMPMAGTGKAVAYLTSVGGNLIWRAKMTGAASGTSSLDDDTAPVYIDYPWVQGVGFWMNS